MIGRLLTFGGWSAGVYDLPTVANLISVVFELTQAENGAICSGGRLMQCTRHYLFELYSVLACRAISLYVMIIKSIVLVEQRRVSHVS